MYITHCACIMWFVLPLLCTAVHYHKEPALTGQPCWYAVYMCCQYILFTIITIFPERQVPKPFWYTCNKL